MLGRSTGAVLVGVDAHLVHVEVDLGGGLPTIAAVGRPDVAVREGIDRIRAALRHAGFKLPQRRIIVNLAPAEVRKQGASLDLTIAAALLLADRQIPDFDSGSALIAGELSLDGSLRPIQGALSMAISARQSGRTRVLLPRANADEAALVEGLDVVPLDALADLATLGRGTWRSHPGIDPAVLLDETKRNGDGPDLSEVRGQAAARRALEVAAAGGHHLLLVGPPGAGKSMLAKRLPGILPPLTVEEAFSVTRVSSAAGRSVGLVTERPFRAPHHGISSAGMTGGGRVLRPGEISLADCGVLYLDELPEFRRDALEALRQPLEDGELTVVRVHASVTLPAAFTLVASMNPCRNVDYLPRLSTLRASNTRKSGLRRVRRRLSRSPFRRCVVSPRRPDQEVASRDPGSRQGFDPLTGVGS
ncbi:MAG: YifB family Mg chelatase-like AAA ATPase [bacterium]|nr:YifB family Mg chelatase-like AAA ATPase [bacterium]